MDGGTGLGTTTGLDPIHKKEKGKKKGKIDESNNDKSMKGEAQAR